MTTGSLICIERENYVERFDIGQNGRPSSSTPGRSHGALVGAAPQLQSKGPRPRTAPSLPSSSVTVSVAVSVAVTRTPSVRRAACATCSGHSTLCRFEADGTVPEAVLVALLRACRVVQRRALPTCRRLASRSRVAGDTRAREVAACSRHVDDSFLYSW